MQERIVELEEEIKQYQDKAEEIVHHCHEEIKAREEEISRITDNEIAKYEKEINDMQQYHNDRESNLLNQLGLLEEEGFSIQNRLQKDR